MAERPPALDDTNRPVWEANAGDYAGADAWTDQGERAALLSVADEVRGGRIIDVGVGAGRSTYLLRLISSDYTGIDYTPDMVALARARHPGVDLRDGDARDLSAFGDDTVDLAVFSFNGLDALSHRDRAVALAEMRRVLRPSGLLLFSGLNKHGPAFGQPPWKVRSGVGHPRGRAFRVAKWVALAGFNLGRYLRTYRNWWTLRRMSEDHGSWGVAPLSAHDFGLLVHYATVAGERAELSAAGFEVRAVWDDLGRPVGPGADSRALYHHFVAAKSASSETIRPSS